MRIRQVKREEFNIFLNYFQDKLITKTLSGMFFYDTFDKTPLAKQDNSGFYIYD
jgi:hypothetical protein